jgi:uncharacterized phage protein gp47/JayE
MTVSITLDQTGIHAPAYAAVLAYLKAQYRSIYGPDVYLENDSQDGQLLAIFARCLHDANSAAVAVYNAFSPATAQGAGLSRNVKINGLHRHIETASTVDVRLIGQAGATIKNGVVQDLNGVRWNLPASVVIPAAGEMTVTAICQTPGAISAAPETVTQIATPTLGWQSVSNPSSAAMGAPVETDAALRRRQAVSVALPSLTVLEGIVGAVAAVDGVTRYAAYENDTDVTDGNGIPSHSISLVVEGGDTQAIAEAIATKKTPGAGTYGATTQPVTDRTGITRPIHFFRPTYVPVTVALQLKALAGYTSAIGAAIQHAVSGYINMRAIGEPLRPARLYLPANLNGATDAETFEITALSVGRGDAKQTMAEVPIAFNQAARCTPDAVKLTVE